MPQILFGNKTLEVPDGFGDPGLPSKELFSHSQFRMYQRCPKQYYYRYPMGMKVKPGVAMTKGNVIHEGAEKTHSSTIKTGKPLSLTAAKASVSDAFDKIVNNTEIEGMDNPGMVKDQTLKHFEVYYRQAVPVIRPLAVEKGFAVKLGSVPLVGFIDLVDEILVDRTTDKDIEGEGPAVLEVVADLKFTGKRWSEHMMKNDTQLTLYAHVQGTPRVRIDFLLDQRTGTKYVQERSLRNPHAVKLLTEDMEETVDLIKRGHFPRCDPTGWQCSGEYCGYYKICRGPK